MSRERVRSGAAFEFEQEAAWQGARTGSQPRHILHIFPTFGLGGVPIRISDIINHFGERYRHTIVALNNCFDCKSRIDPELRIEFKPIVVSKYGLLQTVPRLRGMLHAMRPDLLLTYNWGAIEWALANNISPICRHIHLESGFGLEEANHQLRRRVFFRRLALARSSRLVVPSHSLVDIAIRVWKLDPRKVVCIPNGVDCSKFAARPVVGVPRGFSKATNELIVGTVAPLRPEKNLQRLLVAFAAMAPRFNVRLLVVGDGPERQKLSEIASQLGVDNRVIFAGHVEEVEKLLGWFDVFALSSDTEQMPNSLLQAMAAGRAVAAVDVGDVKRMLSPENRAFVVPRDDEGGFANVLGSLLGEAGARIHLGQRNQAYVQRYYSEERMFRAYAAVFEDRS